MAEITKILSEIEQGDTSAAEQLLPLMYDELRKLAAARLANEKPGQTLQATALVHEAYLRLVNDKEVRHWKSRGHFFGAAAEAMRRIIVDSAMRKKSAKRGGQYQRVEIAEDHLVISPKSIDLIALDEALDKLALHDARKAELVKLATNGTDIWLLDAKQDKVFKYTSAASRLSGSQNAATRCLTWAIRGQRCVL